MGLAVFGRALHMRCVALVFGRARAEFNCYEDGFQ